MSNKRTSIKNNNNTKKRCPKGYRRDKKTGDCIKYIGFSVFDELKDIEISQDGKTISIEYLEEGGIIKIYQEGKIIRQDFLDKKVFEKTKENTKRDMKRIFKVIKKLEKDPNIILKDKSFQRFKKQQEKKMKKGGGDEKKSKKESAKIVVQKDVIDNYLTDPNIATLQKRVDDLQEEIHKEKKSIYINWWSQFAAFNLFEMIGTTIGYSITESISNYDSAQLAKYVTTAHTKHLAAATTANNWAQNTLLPGTNLLLPIDIAGAAFLLVMDMVNSLYPSETLSNLTNIAQYLYWIWLIGSTFVYLIPISWLWIASIAIPSFGILSTLSLDLPNTNKINKLEEELAHTKERLAVLMKKTYE